MGSKKAKKNLGKHGVSFDEAATAFEDPLYIDFFDPEHSDDEHRYIRVGCLEQGRVLVVSYTERTEIIRLISARCATKMSGELMKKNKEQADDELLPEYDLKNLRIRKFGPARKTFPAHGVVLEPDVASIFPNSRSVNEALRFLMRVTKSGEPTLPTNSKP